MDDLRVFQLSAEFNEVVLFTPLSSGLHKGARPKNASAKHLRQLRKDTSKI